MASPSSSNSTKHHPPLFEVDSETKILDSTSRRHEQTTDPEFSDSSDTTEYKEYRIRWFMLFILCFLNFCSAILWYSFAPIATICASYYNVSVTAINWLSLSYMIVFLFTYFPAAFTLDKYDLRIALFVGSFFNLVGCWLRVISIAFNPTDEAAFIILFIGQVITGIAQPFLLVAPTKMATLWFSKERRAVANAIMSISNPLGIAAASAISPIIVSDENPSAIDTVLWVYAIVTTVSSLLALGVKARPPTPPSPSADNNSLAFGRGIKDIFLNKSYWVLLISFGLGLGMFNSLTTLLEQILRPYGYNSDDAGLAGAMVIVFGLIGAGVAGAILDYTKRFKEVMWVCFSVATVFFLAFVFVSSTNENIVGICTVISFIGFFSFAILPTCLELSVETTFPIAEGTSAGGLWMSGQFFGIVLILLMDGPLKRDDGSMKNGLWLLVACGVAASVISFFWSGTYKRLQHDRAEQLESELESNETDDIDVIPRAVDDIQENDYKKDNNHL